MATYDNDRDGSLNQIEFTTMYRQNRDKFPVDWNNDFFLNNDTQIQELFRKFDTNHSNKLEYSELKKLLKASRWKNDENTIAKLVTYYYLTFLKLFTLFSKVLILLTVLFFKILFKINSINFSEDGNL